MLKPFCLQSYQSTAGGIQQQDADEDDAGYEADDPEDYYHWEFLDESETAEQNT